MEAHFHFMWEQAKLTTDNHQANIWPETEMTQWVRPSHSRCLQMQPQWQRINGYEWEVAAVRRVCVGVIVTGLCRGMKLDRGHVSRFDISGEFTDSQGQSFTDSCPHSSSTIFWMFSSADHFHARRVLNVSFPSACRMNSNFKQLGLIGWNPNLRNRLQNFMESG